MLFLLIFDPLLSIFERVSDCPLPGVVFILMFSCRSKYYRQNLIFSDVSVPEITALFNKHCHSILYKDFMRLTNLYRSFYVHLL